VPLVPVGVTGQVPVPVPAVGLPAVGLQAVGLRVADLVADPVAGWGWGGTTA